MRTIFSAFSAKLPANNAEKWMDQIEKGCGIALLLIVVLFHAQMMLHAGALWRDEINTVNMASMKSLGEIFKNIEYDSFPMLWFLIVRGWMSAGLGSELGLRILGMLIGLGGTLSCIWVCRKLDSRNSLVALVLLGFCPTVYLIGDSLRAYGCGMMLIFLTLGLFWKAVKKPSPGRILSAGLLAILSVQCLFYNAILLFAMGIGGLVVGFHHRDAGKIAVVLGIGAAAALSLVPYWPAIKHAGTWNILFRIDFTIPLMMGKIREAVEPAGAHIFWVWLLLLAVAITACVWWWFRKSQKATSTEQDRVTFIFTTLVVAIVANTVFLKLLSYPTQPWYYLSILAMMAVTINAAAGLAADAGITGRIIRLAGVLLVMATTAVNTWNAVQTRQTNVDLVAARLESFAGENDLIVINPFFFGIPFARYYKGNTPWVTVPPLTEYRIHRYDMFKAKMAETDPLASVHEKIKKTLQAGNRVWVLGWITFLRDGELPGELPPAPQTRFGWSESAYSAVWWRQIAYLIQHHVNRAETVKIGSFGPVNHFENVPLFVFQGWHP